jgi:hypothetical protein
MEPLGFDAVRMLIWCPNCHEQHIDDGFAKPHILHRCEFCQLEWKFSEWNTLGILSLPNHNHYAKNAKPKCFATLKDFDEAVTYATKHLQRTQEQQDEAIKRAIAAARVNPNWASELGCPLVLVGIGLMVLLIAIAQYLLK